jgi:hypothetical protein
VTRHDPTRHTPGRLSAPPPSAAHSVTGSLIEELWNLSPDEDITGWTPEEIDATLVRTGIRLRMVVALAILAVALLLAGWRALAWDDTQLAQSIESVEAASSDVVTALGSMDGTIADIADGRVDDALGASTSIARLDEAARSLFSLAGDMPTSDDAAPVRERTIAQAGGALSLGTVLSETVAYASAIELVTRPLELPTETDLDGLRQVTERVTAWVSDFASGVAALPSNDVTDTHRRALVDLAASMPTWQASYLDSLRARDPGRAEDHVEELEVQIRFVRSSWNDTAASIASWATDRVAELATPVSP